MEPIGNTPCENIANGEFITYYALNYARETVYLAKKVLNMWVFDGFINDEGHVFRRYVEGYEPYTYETKTAHMRKFRKELMKFLRNHYNTSTSKQLISKENTSFKIFK